METDTGSVQPGRNPGSVGRPGPQCSAKAAKSGIPAAMGLRIWTRWWCCSGLEACHGAQDDPGAQDRKAVSVGCRSPAGPVSHGDSGQRRCRC